MIRWYLREVFLALKRTVNSSVISIFGMSVGIAIFMLIMLYVRSELRVNRDFPEYENMYRISIGDGTQWQGIPARIGEILNDNLPECKSFVRLDPGGTNHVLKINNIPHRPGKLVYADSSFFRLFALPFKQGDPASCLKEKYNMVITESLSERLFGDESPVGKTVRLDNKYDARITAVIFDPGQRTNISGDVFISFHSMTDMRNWPDLYDCWGCYNYQTYLLFEKNTDPEQAQIRVNEVLDRYGTDNSIQSLVDDKFALTNMHKVYFGPEERPDFRKGNYTQLKLLGSIGILILLIAVINYINLSTAQASSRLRQLALRKVMGASRRMLVTLVLGEAVLISLISVNVGLVILEIVKPLFNSILDLDIRIGYLDSPWVIPVFLLEGIVIGLISGIYPALSITGFNTGGSISSEIRENASGGNVRKILTIFQVFVSIALIGCTLIIYGQLRYINNSDLGFDKDILVYMPLNAELRERSEVFREELLKHTGIQNISYSYASYRTSNERWGFEFNDDDVSLHMESVDENYLSTLGLELVSGRDFRGRQDSGTILVNQEACRQYFGDNPEGTILESLDGTEIIGVVKDFRFLTFDREIEPIGLMYRPSWSSICNIRLSGSDFSSALNHMEEVWSRFCLEYPFEYHFVDKLYEDRYNKQKSVGELLMFFAVISVLIASLGIFGLATFTVVKRSKEVGIRKVNGSSIFEIVRLLSVDINRIVLWSLVPAFTAVFIIMNSWLSGFAFRISMPWWVYLVSAIIVWLVAVLSTIGKTLKTASINPAEVLRTE